MICKENFIDQFLLPSEPEFIIVIGQVLFLRSTPTFPNAAAKSFAIVEKK